MTAIFVRCLCQRGLELRRRREVKSLVSAFFFLQNCDSCCKQVKRNGVIVTKMDTYKVHVIVSAHACEDYNDLLTLKSRLRSYTKGMLLSICRFVHSAEPVTNISCLSDSVRDMTCSWCEDPYYNETTDYYNFTYTEEG